MPSSFRDRFFDPKVAQAIMSPLGIVLFGVATAVPILVGLPVVAAAAIGVAAWATRVLAAVPRGPRSPRVHASALGEPWRGYVTAAQESKTRFDRVIAEMSSGPLRTRLADVAARLEHGIAESWRIARRGNEITNALAKLDTIEAQADLARMRAQITARSPAAAATEAEIETMRALEAQLQSADRLQTVAAAARDRLQVLDARYDELVARAIEVSVGAGDTTVLGHDVDSLVSELESLRVALDETNQADRSSQTNLP